MKYETDPFLIFLSFHISYKLNNKKNIKILKRLIVEIENQKDNLFKPTFKVRLLLSCNEVSKNVCFS